MVENQISENAPSVVKNDAMEPNGNSVRAKRSLGNETMANQIQPTEPSPVVNQTIEVSPGTKPLVENLESQTNTDEQPSGKKENRSEITETPQKNSTLNETSIVESQGKKNPLPADEEASPTKKAENIVLKPGLAENATRIEVKPLVEVKSESISKEMERKPIVKNTSSIIGDSNIQCLDGAKTIKTYPKNNFISISYENCHFSRLATRLTTFSTYGNLKTLNISNVGLEIFDVIHGAENLEAVFAKFNKFTEIPSGLFTHSKNLVQLDLSHNSIDRIDPFAFADLARLKNLNVSWNKITTILPTLFNNQVNLEILDLSHNQLNVLDAQLFNQVLNLVSLDLSHNQFKRINFELFSGLINLLSMNLNGNQLTDMDGFKIYSNPKLKSFGINNNSFNCSYLEKFLANFDKSIDFANGQLTQSGDNIQGIFCIKSNASKEKYIEKKLHAVINNIEDVVSTMKLSLALLCFAIFVLIIFIVAIRRKVNKATGRTAIYRLSEDVDGRKEGKVVIST